MHLVNEEDRFFIARCYPPSRRLHDATHVAHTRGDSGELHEVPARGASNQVGQGCLARAGWAPQNDGGDSDPVARAGRQKAAQGRAFAQEVTLTDDLVKARGAHSNGEGRVRVARGHAPVVEGLRIEQIHEEKPKTR